MTVVLPPRPDWSQLIKSGCRVFVGGNAGVPYALIDDLIANSKAFTDIELVHMLALGDNRWAKEEYRQLFKVNTFFIHGDEVRRAVDEGRADYTPVFLSEMSSLFSDGTLPLDAALVMVSPPDEFGYCSLGVSVDICMSAARHANKVIAQINPQMPRTAGHSYLHISEFSAVIEADQPLQTIEAPPIDSVTERIGQYVAMLVEDGATLQFGVGKIPSATLKYLERHKDLGIHSEMLSDSIMEVIAAGAISNRKKTFHPGKIVTSFCMGSQKLYDFVNNNPHIEFYPSSYVNKPTNIAKNDNMIAINSALEVDLTGQVVADSLGFDFYSGIGGQVDFVSGASMSKGGKPIIALPSTAKNETVSRIVPHIAEGSGVVTSRGNVHYIVTEYGIASLRGKSIRERALELIRVAHPKFRAKLLAEVRQNYWVPHYQQKYPTDIPELGAIQLHKMVVNGETFYLRPLNPADERRLQEFFYSHTKETLRLRYNYDPKQMSREKSCNLVSVDQSSDAALCIVRQEGSRITIHAVGRFYYNEHDNTCEAAFVTRETQQGKGMASKLLTTLIDIAQKRKINKMLAFCRADNKPMIAIFEHHGFKRLFSGDPSEVELALPLQDANQEESA
ncbi:GNAT family N-acetyltransferase [Aestuariibacter sp. GS-14]|uniref:bifunctional acetyl-CoA hydrolase/transferase family protein/GNAT family N-acetyltransferase n=1 Tax=Aestuariibacter sp. GS-14 TaxID=2590670 RepID=UPI00112DEE7E|nr:bifunctional acetyl-CoA hydrolase/transferase family protein/GNAT family N-acetyltransferase [Aestuariibacter sp. GS-14]TPV54326.1 GNAT family N-acetyltransferase [Aestuariibacter sp. GS-14]